MAQIVKINSCLARVPVCHGYRKRAFLNPAALLPLWQGISFLFSENGGTINLEAAFVSALSGGYRNNNGNFNNMGNNANFWTASAYSSSNAWKRNLNYNNSEVNRNNNNKDNGYSVRLVRHLIKQLLLHGSNCCHAF